MDLRIEADATIDPADVGAFAQIPLSKSTHPGVGNPTGVRIQIALT